jgi:hypothetical protein
MDSCENTNTEVEKVTIQDTPTIIYVEMTQQPRDYIFKVFSQPTTVFNTSGQIGSFKKQQVFRFLYFKLESDYNFI